LRKEGVPADVLEASRKVFDEALELGRENGYRNAQVTVLAPTGTIAFMMDCDTTGIEPDIALIKYKKLVGEGFLKIVNNTVPTALKKLGYTADETQRILDHINEQETIEGAPDLKPEHLPVFDCAFKPVHGHRSIHYMGHVRMMSAVQPFISGAISKTVNMPEAATADEIEQVYLEGWKLGLKAIAIYRDNSKRSQPLSTGKKKDEGSFAEQQALIAQLQYGVPLRDLVNKFAHVRFEPSGFTGNSEIPIAKSIIDYIFRWLGSRFLTDDDKSTLGLIDRSQMVESADSSPSTSSTLAARAGGSEASTPLADASGGPTSADADP